MNRQTNLSNMQKFVAIIFFLSFLFIHGTLSKPIFDYPYRYCSDDTLSLKSTYFPNLQALSSVLSSNASRKLYHKSSVGRPPNPTVYGDFQCRGDLNATACSHCVATATSNSSQQFCPLSVGAVIWFDECFLRYSNRSFFSTVVKDPPAYILTNTEQIEVDAGGFDQVVGSTLNDTVANASSSSVKFATKEANFRDATIYILAQCTGDLSNSNCGECLRDIRQNFPVNGKKGARILSPSCTIRYELYPFYGGVSPSSVSTPPAESPSDSNPSPAESPSDSNSSPAESPPNSNPSPPGTASPPTAPSLPSSPSAPAPSTAAPPLLSEKGRARVAMVIISIVVSGYFV